MPRRAPLGVMAALHPGDLGHLSGQELGEHAETDIDRRIEQSMAHVGREDLELAFDLLRKRLGQPSALEVGEPETRHKAQLRSRGALRA